MSRPAISRRRSSKLVDGLESGLSHQTLLGRDGKRQDIFTSPTSSSACSARRWCWRTTRRWRRSCTASFATSSRSNAVEYFVSYYDYYQPEAYVPSSDTYIEKDSSVNEHIEQMRLSATKALLERPDRSSSPPCPRSTAWAIRRPICRWCCTWCAASASISAGCCGGWPRCSTRAMTWICSRAPIACAATSSTSFRPSRAAMRCASSCSTSTLENLSLIDPLTGATHRPHPALHGLSGHALRDAARPADAGDRSDPRGAARAPGGSCMPTASWWRRSGSSSARCSIWR